MHLLMLPKGPRALALFHHAEGRVPDSLDDVELTGRALAHIHRVAYSHAGPASRYTLDGHHLAGLTLEHLSTYPGLGADVLASYRHLIHRLLDDLTQLDGGLTRVVCHGDTHGVGDAAL